MSDVLPQRKRRRLLAAGSAAALAAGFDSLRLALAQGTQTPGIYRIQGRVRVNGKPVQRGQTIVPGDMLQTGAGGQVIFVMGQDSSRLETAGSNGFADTLRLVTGKLLSVFSAGERHVVTPTATVGIRGTGLYVEAQPKRTYVCTCYGSVVVSPAGMPNMKETITTEHHEQPRYIYADSSMPEDKMMPKAAVVNHTDAELILLESLVGREPPFVGKGYKAY